MSNQVPNPGAVPIPGQAYYALPNAQVARAMPSVASTSSTPGTPQASTPQATTSTPRPSNTRSSRAKKTPATPATSAPLPPNTYTPAQNALSMSSPALSLAPPRPPPPPLPTTPQALNTTYPSRLRTGTTLLVQPVIAPASGAATSGNIMASMGAGTMRRRGGVVNYAEGASGDEFVDDSGDSDYIVGQDDAKPIGSRSSTRRIPQRTATMTGAQKTMVPTMGTPGTRSGMEIDRSYLGEAPPARLTVSKLPLKTPQKYISIDQLEKAASSTSVLIPIRVELDTEHHRIRDCFLWNLNEDLLTPELFALTFCNDLEIPQVPYVDQIAGTIKAQLDEHSVVASFDVGISEETGVTPREGMIVDGVDEADCRVILSLDVQIDSYHLLDHIEWDLSTPPSQSITPAQFASILCADLGLTGEAAPLVAHALHEEILKHKKDAIEWGVLGGDNAKQTSGRRGGDVGPKRLRGVWRDWAEMIGGEFGPRLEIMSAEEMEKRELERERVSRRLRRETSRFQKSSRRRR